MTKLWGNTSAINILVVKVVNKCVDKDDHNE